MPEEKVSPRLCTECGHSESAHFSAEMGSFCKFCPTENHVWEHVFGKTPTADAGPRQPDKLKDWQDMRIPCGHKFRDLHAVDPSRIICLKCELATAPPVPQQPSETLKQMTVNNLPQGAVGVPQEAVPRCQACSHSRNRHDIEQPYPCFDCDCDGFSYVPATVPKQWKRGASGHYAEHLSTHANLPEECSACKAIEAQMATAPDMEANPQRTGTPHEVVHGRTIACHAPPRCKRVEPAAAPDWAMRAAEQINQRNRARGHVLKARNGSWADVMPTEEIAALIREAGSERERELREYCLKRAAENAKRAAGDDDPRWFAAKADTYRRIASRLLGGESK